MGFSQDIKLNKVSSFKMTNDRIT
ncbi:unnamed protein product [Victoria cruziana]